MQEAKAEKVQKGLLPSYCATVRVGRGGNPLERNLNEVEEKKKEEEEEEGETLLNIEGATQFSWRGGGGGGGEGGSE